jgi:hypothetical protein
MCAHYTTGPGVAYEGAADLNKVARHIHGAQVPNRESTSPQVSAGLAGSLTCLAQRDIMFQIGISSLTIVESRLTRSSKHGCGQLSPYSGIFYVQVLILQDFGDSLPVNPSFQKIRGVDPR